MVVDGEAGKVEETGDALRRGFCRLQLGQS